MAYALTVHKTQGSEFDYVFVVIPKQSRLLSREVAVYSVHPKAKKRLILLIEGTDLSVLFDYSRPEIRNPSGETRTYSPGRYGARDEVPFGRHLIHRAEAGHLVRSKSELVIANMLFAMRVEYQYERRYEGGDGRKVLQISLPPIPLVIRLSGSTWACFPKMTIANHGNVNRSGTNKTDSFSMKIYL
ncbi:MAG: ATP-binding domain-containing protein [Chloroflexi bacterium]|nr:ATP-binding domain-containing protein [Chloroflexota bacterium]